MCLRICSCSRRADRGVVCVCVSAGMRPEATRWAPTRLRAAEQAASRRYLMRVLMKNITLIFLNLTRLIQPRRSPSRFLQHRNTFVTPQVTRWQKLKLHADNSTTFTSCCSHEQHKYSTQADNALSCTSGTYCSLQTPTSARLLVDAFSSRDTDQSVKVVEDTGFVAQWSRQLTDRERSSKVRAREPSQASRGFTIPKETLCIMR